MLLCGVHWCIPGSAVWGQVRQERVSTSWSAEVLHDAQQEAAQIREHIKQDLNVKSTLGHGLSEDDRALSSAEARQAVQEEEAQAP